MAGDALKLAAVAVLALCAVMIVKNYRPELAVMVSMAAGISILIFGIKTASGVADAVHSLMTRYGLDPEGMRSVFKMTGIAYIAQFCADTCRDCGESSLAGKVELAGRMMLVTAAIPLVISTVEAIGGLMKP